MIDNLTRVLTGPPQTATARQASKLPVLGAVLAAAPLWPFIGFAQSPAPLAQASQGAEIWRHRRAVLQQARAPEYVVRALTTGVMRQQGAGMTVEERQMTDPDQPAALNIATNPISEFTGEQQ